MEVSMKTGWPCMRKGLLLWVAVAGLAACGNEALSGAGESCTKTADCEAPLKCVNLVCNASYSGSQDIRISEDIDSSATGDTWTDPISGLTWQVTPTGGTMEWSDAKAHCAGLSLDGGGWRLPNIGELRSLIRGCPATQDGGSCRVEEGDCLSWSCWGDSCDGCSGWDGPADGCYWPDEMQGTCSWYWSSSPVGDTPDFRWRVDFNDGDVNSGGVTNGRRVRCVRDAP